GESDRVRRNWDFAGLDLLGCSLAIHRSLLGLVTFLRFCLLTPSTLLSPQALPARLPHSYFSLPMYPASPAPCPPLHPRSHLRGRRPSHHRPRPQARPVSHRCHLVERRPCSRLCWRLGRLRPQRQGALLPLVHRPLVHLRLTPERQARRLRARRSKPFNAMSWGPSLCTECWQ